MGLGAALLPTWIPVSTPLILWQVPDPAASVSTPSLSLCALSLSFHRPRVLSRHGILASVSLTWPSFSHGKTMFLLNRYGEDATLRNRNKVRL